MKRIVFIIFTLLIFVNLIGCNISKTNTDDISKKVDTVYTNPIDKYFLPKIYNNETEIATREWQDEYCKVWSEEFDKIMQIMKAKCVYQKDIDALQSYKESINNLIEKTSSILVTDWLDDYQLPPDSAERGSWGNGTESGLNMKKAEIFRDASMLLIPYCDKYIYPNLK